MYNNNQHFVGEHLTEDFRNSINRFNKLPCIDYNGFRLSESVAILRFLAAENLIPNGLAYNGDFKRNARIDEYLNWTHNNLRLGSGMYFMCVWAIPILTQSPPDEDLVSQFKAMYEKALDDLENIWLDTNYFICGDDISVADVFAACDIEQPRICGYDPCENRPRITRWLNAVKEHLNPHFNDAHEFIYKYADKYKGVAPISKL